MIKNSTKNLLDSDCTIIAHQVNCQGQMGSGVAKCIREKYFNVYSNYKTLCNGIVNKNLLLGQVQLVENEDKIIANLFAQEFYGYSGKQYTDYDAFEYAISQLYLIMKNRNIKSVALPYKIGSDRGGANWDRILAIIKKYFEEDPEILCEICKLPKNVVKENVI